MTLSLKRQVTLRHAMAYAGDMAERTPKPECYRWKAKWWRLHARESKNPGECQQYADNQMARTVEQFIGFCLAGNIGNRQRHRAVIGLRHAGKPIRAGTDTRRRAANQRRHDRLGILRVRQRVTLGRRIECDTEAHVARRRHRRDNAECRGNLARQIIGAMMPAEQRHHRRPIFGNGQQRWLGALVGKRGRNTPDVRQ